MYKQIIRPLLFSLQPETIHHAVFTTLKIAAKVPVLPMLIKKTFTIENPALQKEVFGIKFPNPIGLAAGMDKDADAFDMLGYLGFGFVEIGTVS